MTERARAEWQRRFGTQAEATGTGQGPPGPGDPDYQPPEGYEQLTRHQREGGAALRDEPTPLRQRIEPPPFPVDVLPPWLADMVAGVATFTQTDQSMAGGVALSALAACAGGRVEVEARPGWREPTNLFIAIVARPGERKTAVQAAFTRPLQDAERDLVASAGPLIEEAIALKEIAEARASDLKRQAARKDGPEADELTAEAIGAATHASSVDVPTLPRLLAGDATPEALASLMAENDGKIALVSDEGGIFDVLAGRYTANPNLDPFLQGHAGAPIRVDRKGRDPEFIPKPALTMALMFQPEVLRQVGANLTFTGRGLVARNLFVLPTSRVGTRKVDADVVPAGVAEDYHATVRKLARELAGWTDPAVVPLTDDARQEMFKFAQHIEDRLGPGGDLDHVADWANKLVGAVVRLAGLLHVAHHLAAGTRQPVEAETMRAAVRLGEFFIAHYLASFDEMGANQSVDDAEYVLAMIQRMGQEQVTVREVFNRVTKRRFPTVPDLTPVLATLEAHGYLRRLPDPERTGPGRPPSPTYAVRPQTPVQHSANTAE